MDRPSGACDRPSASRVETNHIIQVYLGVAAVSRSSLMFITLLSDDPLCATYDSSRRMSRYVRRNRVAALDPLRRA